MKTLRCLLFAILFLPSLAGLSQNVTLMISGHVTDIVTQEPIPGHLVSVLVYGSNTAPDSVYATATTDAAGYYAAVVTFNYVQGTAKIVKVSTWDCQGFEWDQFFTFTGMPQGFTADFAICGGNPPVNCDNYISVTGIQDLTVAFAGNLYNQQPATYTWEFGDGITGTGQYPVHTYPSYGMFQVTLMTITNDSCFSMSQYMVSLPDSINTDCQNFISFSPTNIPLEIAFQGFTQSPFPTEFEWNFGDPASGSNNYSSLQNPYHIFSAQGSFTVTLATSDTTGCSYSSSLCIQVSGGGQNGLTISGQVIAGNSMLDQGIAVLFATDSMGYVLPVQTATIDSMGGYTFTDLFEGSYLVWAAPTPFSQFYPEYLPTFYVDAFQWENATVITLGTPQNPYNINLVHYDSIWGGNGWVNGQLIWGGKSAMVAGQEVLLLDNAGTPVRLAYTDPAGNFSFPGLPLGTYQVNPMITGLTTFPVSAELTENSPGANVIMIIEGNTITGLVEDENTLVQSVYPNPASDELTLALKPGQRCSRIEITDASGKPVSSFTPAPAGNLISLKVGKLARGIYFLQLKDEKGNSTWHRFIKK